MVRQAKKRNPPKRVQMTAGGEEVRDSSAVPGQKCSAQTALFCPCASADSVRRPPRFSSSVSTASPKRAGGFARSHKSFASMQDTRRIPARRTSRERRRI